MKILFLSHYFPPEVNAPANRTYEHCKEWVKSGHKVTVVNCVPHHPMGKVYPGYKNKFFQVEEKDGITAIKVWTYITANSGFLKRVLNYIFYMNMAILVAPFIGKADVVISTSPQFFNGLAGYFVSKIKHCPWILEIRDLWPESIVAVGAIRNRRIIAVLGWLEQFAYRKADRIVPVTNSFKEYIVRCGIDKSKLTVIRNGVDLSFYHHMDRDNKFADKIGVGDRFVASYVGTHGMAHGLDVILSAADKLREQTNIVFLLVGDGAERKRLGKDIKDQKLTNVILLGQLPKEDMPKIWSITDVSLVLLKKLDLFLTVIPSKIFECMAMKKPIILGVKGESSEIIEEAKSGICIEPENAGRLADSVQCICQDENLGKEFGENGLKYVTEHFNRIKLASEYEAILLSVVES